ncbi:hypothetical protein Tsubulata_029629, partial [Turnera subulata]
IPVGMPMLEAAHENDIELEANPNAVLTFFSVSHRRTWHQRTNKDSFKARCVAEGTSSEGSNGEEVCAAPDKEKEVALWVEVACGVKKGRVYGLAGQARWSQSEYMKQTSSRMEQLESWMKHMQFSSSQPPTAQSTLAGNDEEMNDDSEDRSSSYETGEDDGMDSEED